MLPAIWTGRNCDVDLIQPHISGRETGVLHGRVRAADGYRYRIDGHVGGCGGVSRWNHGLHRAQTGRIDRHNLSGMSGIGRVHPRHSSHAR